MGICASRGIKTFLPIPSDEELAKMDDSICVEVRTGQWIGGGAIAIMWMFKDATEVKVHQRLAHPAQLRSLRIVIETD